MNTMNRHPGSSALGRGFRHAGLCAILVCASLASVVALAASSTPGAPVTFGNVEVSYSSPNKLTEVDRNPNERTEWLDQLSAHVAKRASRELPAGQKLSVTITDVQLAGMYEPWRRGNLAQARIVRDTTPPRIDLKFKLESATGAVIKEGERELRDIDFQSRTTYRRDEPLSHEKNLIDSWLTREFGPSKQ